MKKYILIVVVILLAASAVGLGIWFREKSRKTQEAISRGDIKEQLPVRINEGASTPETSVTEGANGLSTAGSRVFGTVTDKEVLDYAVDSESIILLAEKNGAISKIADGKTETIYSPELQAPLSASFSHDGKKLLSSFGDAKNPDWSVFDIASGEWKQLASGIRSAAWSPSDYRIAYSSSFKNGGSAIAVFDLGARTPREEVLASFSASELIPSWGTSRFLFVSEPATAFAKNSVWRIDIAKKILQPLVIDKIAARVLWDRDGTEGLVFTFSETERKNSLDAIDENGNAIRTINFVTLPEKCTFYSAAKDETGKSARWTICAVPRNASDFPAPILPDDYYKKAFFSADNIYAIKQDEGLLVPLFEDSSFEIDAYNIKTFGEVGFFINRKDGKLYAVSLKPIFK